MALWRIFPVAAPSDSRWQGREIWEEVIVRASNPAFARIVASRLEAQRPRHSLGNESPAFRTAFMDDKLYWVRRLSSAEAARYDASGPPYILAARKMQAAGAARAGRGYPDADSEAWADAARPGRPQPRRFCDSNQARSGLAAGLRAAWAGEDEERNQAQHPCLKQQQASGEPQQQGKQESQEHHRHGQRLGARSDAPVFLPVVNEATKGGMPHQPGVQARRTASEGVGGEQEEGRGWQERQDCAKDGGSGGCQAQQHPEIAYAHDQVPPTFPLAPPELAKGGF